MQGNKGRRTTSTDAPGRDKLCRGDQKGLGGKKGMTYEREEKCQKGSQRGADSETEEIFFLFFSFSFFWEGRRKILGTGRCAQRRGGSALEADLLPGANGDAGAARAGQEKGAKED